MPSSPVRYVPIDEANGSSSPNARVNGESQASWAVFAIYNTRTQADQAVKELVNSRCDLGKLSVVGRDYQTERGCQTYSAFEDRLRYRRQYGAFWRTLSDLSVRAMVVWIHGLGPIMVTGPLASVFASMRTETDSVHQIGVIGAVLGSLGVPQSSALKYESAIRASQYLLNITGTEEELAASKAVMERTDHAFLELHRC